MSSPSMRALRGRIDDVRRGGRNRIAYVPPTPEENERYRAWVAELARASRADGPTSDPSAREDGPPKGPSTPAPPGFALSTLPSAPEYWILHERQDQRRGAGIVVLRRGPARDITVEAPHTFFDEGTLPISLVAFESAKARALVVNTVHRLRASASASSEIGDEADDVASQAPASDVAHASVSFFLSAHEALLETFPAMLTIQIHGFRDDAATGTVVLSAAGSIAEVPVARVRSVFGEGVRAFPTNVRTLGGTTNVEAKASRRAGAPFLHVEIAKTLRGQLTTDEALCRRFTSALAPERNAPPTGR